MPRSGDDDLTVRKLVLFSSLAVTLISAVRLIVRWDEARRLTRLRAGVGVGVIARWTIDRVRWESFRRLSSEWDQRKDLRPYGVDFTQYRAPDGLVEVVVTLDAIRVGKQFLPIERNVRIAYRAGWRASVGLDRAARVCWAADGHRPRLDRC